MPPRKSSKTAHVLNLLTGSKDSDTSEQENEQKVSTQEKKVSKKDTPAKENSSKEAASKKKSAPEKKSEKASSARTRASAEALQTVAADIPDENTDVSETAIAAESSVPEPEAVPVSAETPHSSSNEIADEILTELSEEHIPINTPPEKMAVDVAEILSENADIDIPDVQTIDPIMEKMRELNQAQPPVHEQQTVHEAPDEPVSPARPENGPFSYVPPQPEIIATPMSKSALASMLIAQRKDEEKKEAEPPAAPEITEETPVYENEDMTLVNLTEKAAAKRIPNVMKRFNMCTCERCYYDVLALTLNSIPQKTVIIPKDDIERKIKEYELDSTVDLITAISKSCVHVKISPRH